jgi:hypothetical protein
MPPSISMMIGGMMEKQFSQEYIDYILSDEAKALQERWEPKIGDHSWYKDKGPWLVTHVSGSSAGITVERIEVVGDFSGLYQSVAVTRAAIREHVVAWLPTLWDLVKVVYDTGWRADEILYELDRGTCANLTGMMIRAAKLAVRALENIE